MSVQRRLPVHISETPARREVATPPGLFPQKLRPPPLSENLLRRPRLEQEVSAGVARGLVVVSAPAGSGKTQLVATWAHHRTSPEDVAWVTLGTGDRDPVRFLRYVVAAIAATPSGRAAMISPAGLPSTSRVTESYLLLVSEALSRLPADVVLVLDDFQELAGSASERLARRVLRYRPERLGAVVVSRVDPDLGQQRLRLEGRVTELFAHDLALTRDECGALLELHGLALEGHQLDVLHARTEGWAAGVQLLAASMRRSTDPDRFLGGLRAGEAFIADYLMTEVFERQPPELRRFLLRASTANPVCGELADTLTGGTDGEQTLTRLYDDQVFLDRAVLDDDATCRWYRWHPLFSELLQQRLRAAQPDLAQHLHRMTAQWLHGRDHPVDAVRQAVAGQDVATATQVLGESWLDLVIAGDSAELHSLLGLFTEKDEDEHAEIAVVSGFVRLQQRDLERATVCAERAVALAAGLPEERRVAVEVAGAAILLHAATLTGRDRADAHRSALALLRRLEDERPGLCRSERRRRALLLYDVGAYEVSRWLYAEPRAHLAAAVAAAGTVDMPRLALGAEAQLAFTDLVAGELDDAWDTAQAVVEAAEERGWRRSSAVVTAHLVIGAVAVVRGDVEEGLRGLREAEAVVHPLDEVNRLRCGFAAHAALRAAGRVAEARQELEQLRARQRRWREPQAWSLLLLLMTEAEQLALEDQPHHALTLVESVPPAALPAVARAYWEVVHAWLLLRCGRPEEARAALGDVVHQPDGWLTRVRAEVVDALVADALAEHDDALRTLDRAVEAAALRGVREPFLACGPEVELLLQELLDRGTPHESEVLDLLGLLGSRRHRARADAGLPEPLTPRELEVLRNLQGTLSNEQIAQRLFVSVNTLRTHIKHVHSKLGTSSRREAVARARELDIL